MTDFLADLGLPSEPTAPLFARDQPAVDFSREAVDKRKADGQRRKAEEADAQRQRSTPRPDDGVVLVNGADLKPEPIRWLWPQWLALGKLHILAGAAGQGKTTINLAFAATVSAGGRWPDGSRCEPGNVLIWSGEDDPADTLLPRLLAMGADRKRIFFVQGARVDGEALPFDPARDMPGLLVAAARIGGIKLLMVDPVVSAVAGDSHKNTEVRRALQPLVDLAAAVDCAAVGITHFSKGSAGRDPTERVTGSIAFGAVARVVLVAAKVRSEDGGTTRILARAKSNIGPDDGGFGYEIEQVEVEAYPGIFASRVTWGEALAGTARELLAEAETDGAGGDGDDGPGDAAAWLRDLLAAGPVAARDVKRSADEAGYAWRTVQRAMRKAGADSRRGGFGKPAEWFLTPAIRATSGPVAPFAPTLEVGANGANGGATDDSEAF
ncbi:MAG: AAA family ATPase [Betaproteobacteria bacterium]|nr:AAA family ATPase [Betaproteobacteria bacterium]